MAARYSTDIDISKSQRDFELKKAAYDMEIQTKKAQSDLAYELQVSSLESVIYSTVWLMIDIGEVDVPAF